MSKVYKNNDFDLSLAPGSGSSNGDTEVEALGSTGFWVWLLVL